MTAQARKWAGLGGHSADRRMVAVSIAGSLALNLSVLSILFFGMAMTRSPRFRLDQDIPFSFMPAELIIDDSSLNPALAPDIAPAPSKQPEEEVIPPPPKETPKPSTPEKIDSMPPVKPDRTPVKVNTPRPTPKDPAREAIERVRQDHEQRAGQATGSISIRGGGGSGVGNRIVSIYLNAIYRKVMNNWASPPGLSGGSEVSVTIHIKVGPDGRIIHRSIAKSSGIPAVDQQAMRAVEKADPLDPPPELIQNVVAIDGIDLRFFPTGR